jgi:dienelactone hydrolase
LAARSTAFLPAEAAEKCARLRDLVDPLQYPHVTDCCVTGQADSMVRAPRFRLIQITRLQAFLLTVILLGQARAEGIRFDNLQIPAVISTSRGSHTFELEGLVVRPDDGQPHPLALLNHGSPRDPERRPKMSPYGMWAQAAALARRGWVAVAFMRRGYGHSQGQWLHASGPCANRDYARVGLDEADDIAAVAKFMSGQNYVSKGKWISVGGSVGGFATLALASNGPPDLVAAITFAPGRGSSAPDKVCGEDNLVAAFAQYGRTARVPVLWVSSENDHFFGPKLTARFADAFSNAGGRVDFVGVPPFDDDGHLLFGTRGAAIWSPILDKFLAAHELVLRDRTIDVSMPDVSAPASLNSRGREAFEAYLESGPNKAFVVGGSHFGWTTGRRSADEAVEDALGRCRPDPGDQCRVVNINDKPAE